MKKKGGVFVYMVLVGAVLLTKVLGLVRGILLSAVYGTGYEASAFAAVSNLPLIIFDVTLGTAISSAFVPVFNEKLTEGGKEKANRFAGNFITIVLLFSGVIVLLGMIFPNAAVTLVASGFRDQPHTMALAEQLMRIIMPIMCFACCTFVFVGILQSYSEFIAPALVSLFSNLSMIVYLVFLNGRFGIKGLAVAFCFGWALQFIFLIPFLKKKRFKYYPKLDFRSPDIKKVALLTLPLFVAALAQPVNQLISSNLSSALSESGVATINYAYNAYFIVAGVFSYALTNMFFPEMSRRFASKDVEGATSICSDMLSSITAIILPIMVFFAVCAKPVIHVLYERGQFTAADTVNVAALLSIYSFGMIFLSWQDILNKYFYSMQKSVMPMLSAAVGITSNYLLSLLFTRFMGLAGLALSTVLSGAVMTVMLCLFTRRYTRGIFTRPFVLELVKLILGGAVSGGVCRLMMLFINFGGSVVSDILYIVLIFLMSCAAFIGSLLLLRSKNIATFVKIFKKGGDKV